MKTLILIIVAIGTFLASNAFADDYTLTWDANSEPDLAGYKLYYKVDGPGPPYDGGMVDVGNVTQYTWTGLPGEFDLAPGQRIRFVVTAYNILGWESKYSNEESTGVPTDPGNLTIADVSSE